MGDCCNLKERCEILEEQIKQLQQLILPDTWQPPSCLNLTGMERVVLGILVERPGFISTNRLHDLVYAVKIRREAVVANNIAVFISRIRKHCKPYGIEIINRHGVGYCLTEKSRDILKTWHMPQLTLQVA